ncbi:MAG TPA: cytochrome c [Opitutaceae bacterium]|jgi:cytochrome c2|nr:cytochrome c [Opitutaceae bacterium]HRE07081.1 cytochrome c [Opitutaceae bacterium]
MIARNIIRSRGGALLHRIWFGLAVLLGLAGPSVQAGLPLLTERSSPHDLAVTGRIEGAPPGSTRYVRWSDLRALPTHKLVLEGEFVAGEQTMTVVYLSDVWKALPRGRGADTVLATCTDGYASVYTEAFVAEYRPFVILEINGTGPESWPPPGINYNPGPYVIFVSTKVAASVAGILDVGHKRPWGVSKIELANYEERYAAIHQGRWSKLSPRAAQGRQIWINSCASCHQGPGGIFGGTKSDRPFEVLAAHAGYNQAYFRRYVRDPQGVVSGAKMEAHPHYSDAQLDALIAFITAEPGT